MDHPTLRILHLTGLALTFMGLAGILAAARAGNLGFRQRLVFHLAHGTGLILLLTTGLALAGMLNALHPLPGWLCAKLVIWLLAGAAMAAATRLSRFAGAVLLGCTALVLAAAWLAIDKPF